METEVKTLVYRDRAAENTDGSGKTGRFSFKSRRFRGLAAAFAAVIAIAVPALILGNGDKNSSLGGDSLTAAETELQTAEADAQETAVTVAEAAADAAVKAVAKDESLFLLNDDNAGVKTVTPSAFIPADFTGDAEGAAVTGGAALSEAGEDTPAEETGTVLTEDNAETDESDAPETEEKTYAENSSGLSRTINEDFCMKLSETDYEALLRIVEAEAGDQDVYGRMLVTNVILNRVLTKEFPNSVYDVVFQRIGGSVQFSPTIKGGGYYTAKVTETTREAVERVLSGEDYSQGALYFFQRSATSKKKASWFDNSLEFILKYGCHEFFREK